MVLRKNNDGGRPRIARSAFLGASAILAVTAIPTPTRSEELREALLRAYQTSPLITAQRAAQRATDEGVPLARAALLPNIAATGGVGDSFRRSGNSFTTPERQLAGNVQLSIPVYQGGAARGSLRAAQKRMEAGRETLRSVEADLFSRVVAAYMDVLRDEAVMSLNRRNVEVLQRNLTGTRGRFRVGDLTQTDVAQSEGRLSAAQGQLEAAEAALIASREDFIRYVGRSPTDLQAPPALPPIPDRVEDAIAIALRDNPVLSAARRQSDATLHDLDVARATRLPRVSVVVGENYTNYLGTLGAGSEVPIGQVGTSTSVGLVLTVPIFQGGAPSARVRQAEALRGQALEELTGAERDTVADTRSAYAAWVAAQRIIVTSESGVDSNGRSLRGVRAENGVGNRTVLDILNAEQELLTSQVQLATARRDAYVAGFKLLSLMGQAEASKLGLTGGPFYDPVANYRRIGHRIGDWGGDGAPTSVAPSTVAVSR